MRHFYMLFLNIYVRVIPYATYLPSIDYVLYNYVKIYVLCKIFNYSRNWITQKDKLILIDS